MPFTDYCTEGIWLEGLDQEAAAFVAAIPQERRAWWDRICIAEESPYGAAAPDGKIFVVFLKSGRFVSQALPIDALRDATPDAVAWLERTARSTHEAAERTDAAALVERRRRPTRSGHQS